MTSPRVGRRAKQEHNVRSQRPVVGPYMTMKLRDSRIAKGLPTSVPGSVVRRHVLWLHDEIGFGDPAIAAAAGISHPAVNYIRTHEAQLTQLAVANRILSVGHIPVPAQAGCRVPATGTRRRLRALSAIGWGLRDLASELDVSLTMVSDWANRRTQVNYDTWVLVTELYETRSATPGPSKRARAHAVAAGLMPPLAWEGIDIDDPRAIPVADLDPAANDVDEVLVHRILRGEHRGNITTGERRTVLDHAIAHGWTKARVATVLNMNPQAADQALVRRRRELRREDAA